MGGTDVKGWGCVSDGISSSIGPMGLWETSCKKRFGLSSRYFFSSIQRKLNNRNTCQPRRQRPHGNSENNILPSICTKRLNTLCCFASSQYYQTSTDGLTFDTFEWIRRASLDSSARRARVFVRLCACSPVRCALVRLCTCAFVLLCACAPVRLCACALVRLCAWALVRRCACALVYGDDDISSRHETRGMNQVLMNSVKEWRVDKGEKKEVEWEKTDAVMTSLLTRVGVIDSLVRTAEKGCFVVRP